MFQNAAVFFKKHGPNAGIRLQELESQIEYFRRCFLLYISTGASSI